MSPVWCAAAPGATVVPPCVLLPVSTRGGGGGGVGVCVSDDTEFTTGKWTSLAVSALSGLSPPNLGVVGPVCAQGNQAILTHDFVHVTHWRIFGYYYPPVLDNWWIDDWITRVYEVGTCVLPLLFLAAWFACG